MKASVGICAGFATTCLVRDGHVSCARDAMRGIAINMSMGVVVVVFDVQKIRDAIAVFCSIVTTILNKKFVGWCLSLYRHSHNQNDMILFASSLKAFYGLMTGFM